MNATHAQTPTGSMRSAEGLPIEEVDCPLCGRDDAEPIAVGEDFEYRTTRDTWRSISRTSTSRSAGRAHHS